MDAMTVLGGACLAGVLFLAAVWVVDRILKRVAPLAEEDPERGFVRHE